MKKITLFCLPYAGGTAMIYGKWKDLLPPSIDVFPIELAGRGKRIYEPLYENIREAVDDTFNIIKTHLKNLHSHYAIFGHSMGGLIAYETALKIKENHFPGPSHIFFSGRGAPHVPRKQDRKIFHTLPGEEFKKEIIELGGTPKEFFDHPELMEILLPILRNDMKIAETYRYPYGDEIKPFDCDITVFIGKGEEVTADHMFGWRQHTLGVCSVHYFEGEHFFLNDEYMRILAIIRDALLHH